jgi:two-component system repressor protein LuxO
MLPASIRSASQSGAAVIPPYATQERIIIERAVSACHGNIAQAAAALEIHPSTIYRKLQAWSPAG